MFEATKTRQIRGDAFAAAYFTGSVLDIGCGPDLVAPHARPFDIEHGDANAVLDYLPAGTFDCVHSSHCLEHMRDPPRALAQWWALVRPGGCLIFVVPDEDLYEQGVWPSAFNADHKATFRLDRRASWSPVSHDVRALVEALPGSRVIECSVQDHGYDRRLLTSAAPAVKKLLIEVGRRRENTFARLMRRGLPVYRLSGLLARLEHGLGKPIDQTGGNALAQIQAIVRKVPAAHGRDDPRQAHRTDGEELTRRAGAA
jgi:SAM-dependent methyltransferase